jgi:hypothetical protein
VVVVVGLWLVGGVIPIVLAVCLLESCGVACSLPCTCTSMFLTEQRVCVCVCTLSCRVVSWYCRFTCLCRVPQKKPRKQVQPRRKKKGAGAAVSADSLLRLASRTRRKSSASSSESDVVHRRHAPGMVLFFSMCIYVSHVLLWVCCFLFVVVIIIVLFIIYLLLFLNGYSCTHTPRPLAMHGRSKTLRETHPLTALRLFFFFLHVVFIMSCLCTC